MVTAQFGSKKFEVSPKKIYTPSGTSFSESIELEETERSGKKPTTSIKGIKLQSLAFDLMLDARFVDILTEFREWKNILNAKTSKDFTLGKYKVGKFYLTQYDLKDIVINKDGEYTKATLSLSFTEDAGKSTSSSSTSSSSTKSSSSSGSKSSSSATTVKSSGTTQTKKNFRVGSTVKPVSGAKWYRSGSFAYRMSNSQGKITVKNYKITALYDGNKSKTGYDAVQLDSKYWIRVEDFTVVDYI